jgi:L-ascorbate metabolism protein UlaG (beta-lactamase superfamily)
MFTDQNATLWSGWALAGPTHRVFYSGDTAMHPEFEEIGQRLGPFDLTMMENGAYNALWSDVHLGPEQAVIAHQLVRGKTLLPVHWGMFDLAVHSWTEPVQRVIAAAEKAGVDLVLPRPGGWVEPTKGPFVDRWWDEQVPWQTLEEAPAWSTSVQPLLKQSVLYSPTPVSKAQH